MRWKDFWLSDDCNKDVILRRGDTITYPHKSWVPEKTDDRTSLFMLFGNPAPHSVKEDIYFAYEGKRVEHRFWKVMRELGYISFDTSKNIKEQFFDLQYTSPFRLAFEVIFTFPTSASKPKWSGVAGIYKLFGTRAAERLLEVEKLRVRKVISDFCSDKAIILALQKDAYNAIAKNEYSLRKAILGDLRSTFNNVYPVFGVPPTRWLYTKKMKSLLSHIKEVALLEG